MGAGEQQVGALVGRPAVAVHPHATLREVAEMLGDEMIGAVVVHDVEQPARRGSRALGIVSERDVARAVADQLDPDATPAVDVMTADVAATTPEATVRDVARLMLDNEIRHVPLVVDGMVVAVISERDVLRALVDSGAPAATP